MSNAHCNICGSPLPPPRRHYCSEPCVRESRNARRRRRQYPRKCVACHARFKPTRRGQRYCCPACRQSDYRVRLQERMMAAIGRDRGAMYALREDLQAIIPEIEARDAMEGRRSGIFGTKLGRILDFRRKLIERSRMNAELRKAGLDPRPPRKNGRAVGRDGDHDLSCEPPDPPCSSDG